MKMYRVECNFGSKYFDGAAKAFAFFEKCKKRHLDVEIWLVEYFYLKKSNRYSAKQELLAYTVTRLPKMENV